MSELERRAIVAFLKDYADLASVERRVRRREAFVATLAGAVVVLNVYAAALDGLRALDLIHYAIAFGFALNVRRIVLDSLERRRDFWIINRCAQAARERLAEDHAERSSKLA